MFAMGVMHTTAQIMDEITTTEVMGDAGPNRATSGQRQKKKRARNLDPDLRTWLPRRSHARTISEPASGRHRLCS